MTALRQRNPRVKDPAYLAYVRKLPCTVSRRAPPSDPAHLRSAALHYGKPHTGMQEKPDDRWVLPLNRELHEEQHRHGDELGWWASYGIPDPFALAVALYEGRPAMPPPPEPKPHHARATKPRKPAAERKPIVQRAAWPQGRKLHSRNELKRRTT